jgi:hypothetical protein
LAGQVESMLERVQESSVGLLAVSEFAIMIDTKLGGLSKALATVVTNITETH